MEMSLFSAFAKALILLEALLIAKLTLLKLRSDIKSGNIDIIALMFAMNSLKVLILINYHFTLLHKYHKQKLFGIHFKRESWVE